jgi:hypothetical protein
MTAVVETVVTLVLLLGDASGSVAFAQNGLGSREMRPSAELRLQAPIGARQPRPQDLPATVLRDEGRATASQRKFDKSLEICRDCGLHP